MTELELVAASILTYGMFYGPGVDAPEAIRNFIVAPINMIAVGSVLFYIINKIWSSVI